MIGTWLLHLPPLSRAKRPPVGYQLLSNVMQLRKGVTQELRRRNYLSAHFHAGSGTMRSRLDSKARMAALPWMELLTNDRQHPGEL